MENDKEKINTEANMTNNNEQVLAQKSKNITIDGYDYEIDDSVTSATPIPEPQIDESKPNYWHVDNRANWLKSELTRQDKRRTDEMYAKAQGRLHVTKDGEKVILKHPIGKHPQKVKDEYQKYINKVRERDNARKRFVDEHLGKSILNGESLTTAGEGTKRINKIVRELTVKAGNPLGLKSIDEMSDEEARFAYSKLSQELSHGGKYSPSVTFSQFDADGREVTYGNVEKKAPKEALKDLLGVAQTYLLHYVDDAEAIKDRGVAEQLGVAPEHYNDMTFEERATLGLDSDYNRTISDSLRESASAVWHATTKGLGLAAQAINTGEAQIIDYDWTGDDHAKRVLFRSSIMPELIKYGWFGKLGEGDAEDELCKLVAWKMPTESTYVDMIKQAKSKGVQERSLKEALQLWAKDNYNKYKLQPFTTGIQDQSRVPVIHKLIGGDVPMNIFRVFPKDDKTFGVDFGRDSASEYLFKRMSKIEERTYNANNKANAALIPYVLSDDQVAIDIYSRYARMREGFFFGTGNMSPWESELADYIVSLAPNGVLSKDFSELTDEEKKEAANYYSSVQKAFTAIDMTPKQWGFASNKVLGFNAEFMTGWNPVSGALNFVTDMVDGIYGLGSRVAYSAKSLVTDADTYKEQYRQQTYEYLRGMGAGETGSQKTLVSDLAQATAMVAPYAGISRYGRVSSIVGGTGKLGKSIGNTAQKLSKFVKSEKLAGALATKGAELAKKSEKLIEKGASLSSQAKKTKAFTGYVKERETRKLGIETQLWEKNAKLQVIEQRVSKLTEKVNRQGVKPKIKAKNQGKLNRATEESNKLKGEIAKANEDLAKVKAEIESAVSNPELFRRAYYTAYDCFDALPGSALMYVEGLSYQRFDMQRNFNELMVNRDQFGKPVDVNPVIFNDIAERYAIYTEGGKSLLFDYGIGNLSLTCLLNGVTGGVSGKSIINAIRTAVMKGDISTAQTLTMALRLAEQTYIVNSLHMGSMMGYQMGVDTFGKNVAYEHAKERAGLPSDFSAYNLTSGVASSVGQGFVQGAESAVGLGISGGLTRGRIPVVAEIRDAQGLKKEITSNSDIMAMAASESMKDKINFKALDPRKVRNVDDASRLLAEQMKQNGDAFDKAKNEASDYMGKVLDLRIKELKGEDVRAEREQLRAEMTGKHGDAFAKIVMNSAEYASRNSSDVGNTGIHAELRTNFIVRHLNEVNPNTRIGDYDSFVRNVEETTGALSDILGVRIRAENVRQDGSFTLTIGDAANGAKPITIEVGKTSTIHEDVVDKQTGKYDKQWVSEAVDSVVDKKLGDEDGFDSVREKISKLTDEERQRLNDGEDVNGILKEIHENTRTKGEADGDGKVKIADKEVTASDFAHEISHQIIKSIRDSGKFEFTDANGNKVNLEEVLKKAYGDQWEEGFIDALIESSQNKRAGEFVKEALRDLLPKEEMSKFTGLMNGIKTLVDGARARLFGSKGDNPQQAQQQQTEQAKTPDDIITDGINRLVDEAKRIHVESEVAKIREAELKAEREEARRKIQEEEARQINEALKPDVEEMKQNAKESADMVKMLKREQANYEAERNAKIKADAESRAKEIKRQKDEALKDFSVKGRELINRIRKLSGKKNISIKDWNAIVKNLNIDGRMPKNLDISPEYRALVESFFKAWVKPSDIVNDMEALNRAVDNARRISTSVDIITSLKNQFANLDRDISKAEAENKKVRARITSTFGKQWTKEKNKALKDRSPIAKEAKNKQTSLTNKVKDIIDTSKKKKEAFDAQLSKLDMDVIETLHPSVKNKYKEIINNLRRRSGEIDVLYRELLNASIRTKQEISKALSNYSIQAVKESTTPTEVVNKFKDVLDNVKRKNDLITKLEKEIRDKYQKLINEARDAAKVFEESRQKEKDIEKSINENRKHGDEEASKIAEQFSNKIKRDIDRQRKEAKKLDDKTKEKARELSKKFIEDSNSTKKKLEEHIDSVNKQYKPVIDKINNSINKLESLKDSSNEKLNTADIDKRIEDLRNKLNIVKNGAESLIVANYKLINTIESAKNSIRDSIKNHRFDEAIKTFDDIAREIKLKEGLIDGALKTENRMIDSLLKTVLKHNAEIKTVKDSFDKAKSEMSKDFSNKIREINESIERNKTDSKNLKQEILNRQQENVKKAQNMVSKFNDKAEKALTRIAKELGVGSMASTRLKNNISNKIDQLKKKLVSEGKNQGAVDNIAKGLKDLNARMLANDKSMKALAEIVERERASIGKTKDFVSTDDVRANPVDSYDAILGSLNKLKKRVDSVVNEKKRLTTEANEIRDAVNKSFDDIKAKIGVDVDAYADAKMRMETMIKGLVDTVKLFDADIREREKAIKEFDKMMNSDFKTKSNAEIEGIVTGLLSHLDNFVKAGKDFAKNIKEEIKAGDAEAYKNRADALVGKIKELNKVLQEREYSIQAKAAKILNNLKVVDGKGLNIDNAQSIKNRLAEAQNKLNKRLDDTTKNVEQFISSIKKKSADIHNEKAEAFVGKYLDDYMKAKGEVNGKDAANGVKGIVKNYNDYIKNITDVLQSRYQHVFDKVNGKGKGTLTALLREGKFTEAMDLYRELMWIVNSCETVYRAGLFQANDSVNSLINIPHEKISKNINAVFKDSANRLADANDAMWNIVRNEVLGKVAKDAQDVITAMMTVSKWRNKSIKESIDKLSKKGASIDDLNAELNKFNLDIYRDSANKLSRGEADVKAVEEITKQHTEAIEKVKMSKDVVDTADATTKLLSTIEDKTRAEAERKERVAQTRIEIAKRGLEAADAGKDVITPSELGIRGTEVHDGEGRFTTIPRKAIEAEMAKSGYKYYKKYDCWVNPKMFYDRIQKETTKLVNNDAINGLDSSSVVIPKVFEGKEIAENGKLKESKATNKRRPKKVEEVSKKEYLDALEKLQKAREAVVERLEDTVSKMDKEPKPTIRDGAEQKADPIDDAVRSEVQKKNEIESKINERVKGSVDETVDQTHSEYGAVEGYNAVADIVNKIKNNDIGSIDNTGLRDAIVREMELNNVSADEALAIVMARGIQDIAEGAAESRTGIDIGDVSVVVRDTEQPMTRQETARETKAKKAIAEANDKINKLKKKEKGIQDSRAREATELDIPKDAILNPMFLGARTLDILADKASRGGEEGNIARELIDQIFSNYHSQNVPKTWLTDLFKRNKELSSIMKDSTFEWHSKVFWNNVDSATGKKKTKDGKSIDIHIKPYTSLFDYRVVGIEPLANKTMDGRDATGSEYRYNVLMTRDPRTGAPIPTALGKALEPVLSKVSSDVRERIIVEGDRILKELENHNIKILNNSNIRLGDIQVAKKGDEAKLQKGYEHVFEKGMKRVIEDALRNLPEASYARGKDGKIDLRTAYADMLNLASGKKNYAGDTRKPYMKKSERGKGNVEIIKNKDVWKKYKIIGGIRSANQAIKNAVAYEVYKAKMNGQRMDVASATKLAEQMMTRAGYSSSDIIYYGRTIANDAVNVVSRIPYTDTSLTKDASRIMRMIDVELAKNTLAGRYIQSAIKGSDIGTNGIMGRDYIERVVNEMQARSLSHSKGIRKSDIATTMGVSTVAELRRAVETMGEGVFSLDSMKKICDYLIANRKEFAGMDYNAMSNNELARSEVSKTYSTWLMNMAKQLHMSKARELAISESVRFDIATKTFEEVRASMETFAKMLSNEYNATSAKEAVDGVTKYIDKETKSKVAASKTSPFYNKKVADLEGRYWENVKKVMGMKPEKVEALIKQLDALLNREGFDVQDIDAFAKANSEFAINVNDADAKLVEAIILRNALERFGGLESKGVEAVLDSFNNVIKPEIETQASRFIQRILDRKAADEQVRNTLVNALVNAKNNSKSRRGKQAQDRSFHNDFLSHSIPDMFAKLSLYFKEGTDAYNHIQEIRQLYSLGHINESLFTLEFDAKLRKGVEAIYGKSFNKVIQELSIKRDDLSHFSRNDYVIDDASPEVDVMGKKVKLAHQATIPTVNATKNNLSIANLIYIYAACKQADMQINNVVYGRDAEYFRQLESVIGPQGVKLADYLSSLYGEIRERISPLCEELTGAKLLSPDKNYCPLGFVQDSNTTTKYRHNASPFPAFMRERKGHDSSKLKEVNDAIGIFNERLASTAHYVGFGKLTDQINTTFMNPKVQQAYAEMYGEKAKTSIYNQLLESLNGGKVESDTIMSTARNWVTATSLFFNLTSAFKQLEGLGAWASELGFTKWATGALTYPISMPMYRDAFKELSDAGVFSTRSNEGISEAFVALKRAVDRRSVTPLNRIKDLYDSNGMILTSAVDKLATCSFAAQYYAGRKQFYLSKGIPTDIAKERAIADTDYAIQLTQQSGRTEMLHDIQRGGAFGKVLTTFAGPSLVRWGMMVDSLHRSFSLGDTKALKPLMNRLLALHVIAPALLSSINATMRLLFAREDEDKQDIINRFKAELATGMILGPSSGAFIVGAIANSIVSKASNYVINGETRGAHRGWSIPIASKLESVVYRSEQLYLELSNIYSFKDMTEEDVNVIREATLDLVGALIPAVKVGRGILRAPENIRDIKENRDIYDYSFGNVIGD